MGSSSPGGHWANSSTRAGRLASLPRVTVGGAYSQGHEPGAHRGGGIAVGFFVPCRQVRVRSVGTPRRRLRRVTVLSTDRCGTDARLQARLPAQPARERSAWGRSAPSARLPSVESSSVPRQRPTRADTSGPASTALVVLLTRFVRRHTVLSSSETYGRKRQLDHPD